MSEPAHITHSVPISTKSFDWVNPTAISLWKRAQALCKAGEIEAAVEVYKETLLAEPLWNVPFYEMGVLLDTHGLGEEASGFYERSIQLDPSSAAAYFNLAVNWKTRRDYAKALALIDTYIRMEPHDPDGYLQAAMILGQMGDHDAETHALEIVVKLDPRHANALNNLGVNKLKAGDRPQARKCFLNALKYAPVDSQLHRMARDNLQLC